MLSEREISRLFASEAEKAVIGLPESLNDELRRASLDSEGLEKSVLSGILKNSSEASRGGVPLCQDTGVFEVFLRIGKDSPYAGIDFNAVVTDGIRAAHKGGLLRASMDDVRPVIHIEFDGSSSVEAVITPRGFGSENYTYLHMLPPESKDDEIILKVIEDAAAAEARPCPPYLIGIGLGGTASKAMELSVKALTCMDFEYSIIEQKILDGVNKLGQGAGGFGGRHTALGVKVLRFPAHIAGLPLAVHIGCWANRFRRFSF